MATPENTDVHGERVKNARPSESMRPKEGFGGWVPKPKKDNEASTKMAVDKDRLVCTNKTEARLGKMWRPIMRTDRAPRAVAATT